MATFTAEVKRIVLNEGFTAFVFTSLSIVVGGLLLFFIGKRSKNSRKPNGNDETRTPPCVYKHVLPTDKDIQRKDLCVLLIDPQNDFCDPKGSLFVPGAELDSIRFAEAFKKFSAKITEVFVTLDTHQRYHIAHALFWVNSKGEHPKPFTTITEGDVAKGTWKAKNPAHQNWAASYVRSLKNGSRFQLTIWPNHCLVGTKGHAVVDPIAAALLDWEGMKLTSVNYVLKGNNAFTEHYSALKAEVAIQDDSNTSLNASLIARLKQYDRIIVAGQALSHCVNFSVRDLVDALPSKSRSKVWVVEDACSSVHGFEEQGKQFVSDMRKLGVRIVKAKEAFL